jgi:hypothetical protein
MKCASILVQWVTAEVILARVVNIMKYGGPEASVGAVSDPEMPSKARPPVKINEIRRKYSGRAALQRRVLHRINGAQAPELTPADLPFTNSITESPDY